MIWPLLLCIPFFLMIFVFINLFKRESIKYEINNGLRCWACKELLEIDLYNQERTQRTCHSCQRDITISNISTRWSKYKYKFKKWVVSKNFRKGVILLVVINAILVTSQILMLIFCDRQIVKNYYTLGNILNLISMSTFWCLFITESLLTTIKKPSKK